MSKGLRLTIFCNFNNNYSDKLPMHIKDFKIAVFKFEN